MGSEERRPSPNQLLREARLNSLSPSGSGRPMSRQELADLVNAYVARHDPAEATLDANQIGKMERGHRRWPGKLRRDGFRHTLGADSDRDLGFYVVRRAATVSEPVTAGNEPILAELYNDMPTGKQTEQHGCHPGNQRNPPTARRREILTLPLIVARVAKTSREMAEDDPDPLTVTEIEDDIERIATEYATTTHSEMLAAVERRWVQVDRVLAGRVSLAARGRLTRAAGQLSYFLSRLAFNLGNFNAARKIAVLSEQYARQVDDRVILASVAGMRSGIAYYRDRYDVAVSVFRDYPPDPPYLAARNAAYRARAYARIGDETAAKRELARMWDSRTDTPPIPGDLPLTEAAMSMFAGCTYAFIGKGDRAEDFARRSVATHEAMGPRASREEWAHALLLVGHSLLNRRHPVVDEAAVVAIKAMDMIREYPTHTVIQRIEDFAVSLHDYREVPAIATMFDQLNSAAQPTVERA